MSRPCDGAGERATVLHSWCVQADWNAPTVVGGQGARLHLADGREILDMSSLAECSNLGHQHPQAGRGDPRAGRAAVLRHQCLGRAAARANWPQALLERSGFEGGRVFFTLGGADANENAVKIARQAAGKPRGAVIARDRSYHGATHLAMALSGDARTQQQVDPEAFGVQHVPPPYAYRCPFGSDDDDECGERAAAAVADRIDALGADNVAAVMMEPNAGTNGIVAPGHLLAGAAPTHRRARRLADRRRSDERASAAAANGSPGSATAKPAGRT